MTSSPAQRSPKFLALHDKRPVFLLGIWTAVAITSVPFERLNDDEVQYFLESKQILPSGPIVHGGIIFIPQLLSSALSLASGDILVSRVLSALAVLVTALAIYEIRADDSTFVGSLLFLSSFYTIRFGMRFFLDPYGGMFAALAVYSFYKGLGKASGAFALVGAISRQLAAPLIPAFVYVAYRKGLVKSFAFGLLIAGVPAAIWIFLAQSTSGLSLTAGRESAAILALPASVGIEAAAWIEFLAISPLVIVGYLLSRGKRSAIEFLPILFSVVTLTLTIGFITNGAATEYPYILNVLMCIPAGVGLRGLYAKIAGNGKNFVVIVALLLMIQFASQSYLATTVSPNHAIGIEDFGYNYDQELLAYLNTHYSGGLIYGSNRDGMLLPSIEPDWVWIPQNLTIALRDNPPWLVTYNSYVRVENVPANSSVVEIGPYLVIHSPTVPLSSFIVPTNPTGRFSLSLH